MCRAGSEGPTRQRRVSPTTGWCRESLRRTSLALVRPGMGEAGTPRTVSPSFSWAGVNKIKSHDVVVVPILTHVPIQVSPLISEDLGMI